jgi:NNP family nitrate/nitrite transporter-like MFS transporter
VVGAVGGLGGFMLPTMLGQFKQHTGSFAAGFVVLACVAAFALALLRWLMATNVNWKRSWRRSEIVGERVAKRAA